MTYYNYPCKGCTDRAVGCHSKCPKYLAARADHKKKAEVIYKAKKVEDGMDSYLFTRIEQIKKRIER